jgi:putative hemolysin
MPTQNPPAMRALPAVRRPAAKRAVPRAVPTPAPATVQPQSAEPDPVEIARLAYSYWEARGGEAGSPEEDWRCAEAELRARR